MGGVFEPNDEPLWAQIRLNIGAFMQQLFRQGAFQGATPREAYFVKCDRTTTTQADQTGVPSDPRSANEGVLANPASTPSLCPLRPGARAHSAEWCARPTLRRDVRLGR